MIASEKIKQLQIWLNQNEKIELLILFEYYAKGTQTIHSDLDLAIQLVSYNELNARQKLNYILETGELLGVNFDLVDLKRIG